VTALHRIAKAPDGPEVVEEEQFVEIKAELTKVFTAAHVDDHSRHLSNSAWSLSALMIAYPELLWNAMCAPCLSRAFDFDA